MKGKRFCKCIVSSTSPVICQPVSKHPPIHGAQLSQSEDPAFSSGRRRTFRVSPDVLSSMAMKATIQWVNPHCLLARWSDIHDFPGF